MMADTNYSRIARFTHFVRWNAMSKYAVFTLAFFLTSLLATGAFADDGDELSEEALEEIDEEDIQRAQDAFNEGASLYYEGEYGRAMVEFRRANELYPHPIFAHNMALANHQLGRTNRTLDAALEARELSQQATDDAERLPDRADATNHGLIVSLQSLETGEEVAEAIAADTIDDDDEPVAVDEPPEGVDDPSSFGALGWGGVGAFVLGAGALTGAALIDRNVVSGKESLENWDDTTTAFNEEKDSLESQQSIGKVLLFSGAGLAAVGTGLVVWELMSSPDSEGSQMAVSPSLTRPGVDVMLRW